MNEISEEIYFDDVEYPIYSLGDLADLTKSDGSTFKSDFMMSFDHPYIYGKLRRVCYYRRGLNSSALRSNIIFLCNIKSENILKEYLYLYMNSERCLEYISSLIGDSEVNEEHLKTIPIPVPSIEIQKEIVETHKSIESFFREIRLWKNNYERDVLNYKPHLKAYNEFTCSIQFGEEGEVKDFCHNWRIVYNGLIWPLAYTYLKATKGSKEESTTKDNHLVFFEFLASFNVIVLISGINNSNLSSKEKKEIREYLWQLYNNNDKTWHMMHFGGWTTLYSRLSKVYRKYNVETPIDDEFFKALSLKKYGKLFNELRDKERNADAHGGLEDDIDVETKLEDLKKYMDNEIFEILKLYSGLKLYYVTGKIEKISPKRIFHKTIALNGPCDPPHWYDLISNTELDPYSLYLYDSLSNKYLKIDNDLIKFSQMKNSKQYGIYLFEGINVNKNIATYKCYQQKSETLDIPLRTTKDTYFKVSEEFLKDVLRLK